MQNYVARLTLLGNYESQCQVYTARKLCSALVSRSRGYRRRIFRDIPGYPGISWDILGYPEISVDIPQYPGRTSQDILGWTLLLGCRC